MCPIMLLVELEPVRLYGGPLVQLDVERENANALRVNYVHDYEEILFVIVYAIGF